MKKSLFLLALGIVGVTVNCIAGGYENRLLPIGLFAIYNGNCGPENENYVQVYRDEFNKGQLDKWFWKPLLFNFHHAQNGQETDEYNTEASFAFLPSDNGTLRIRASYAPIFAKGIDDPMVPDTLPFKVNRTNLRTWPYQSGAITSKWTFHQGKFEIRCRIPSGKYMWPAFWLFGNCADEIDIFEFMQDNNNSHHDKYISCSMHTKLNCADTTQNADTESFNVGDVTGEMHLYSVFWDDFKIVFMVDDQPVRTMYHYYRSTRHGNHFDYTAIENCQLLNSQFTYVYDPQFSDAMMEIIINSAVRNGAPANTLPKDMLIDYFALYEPMACLETEIIQLQSELSGVHWGSAYGDRTINAGNIRIMPTFSISLESPVINYNPGDLLILTATHEIQILPGFEVLWDANLIGQIAQCQTIGPNFSKLMIVTCDSIENLEHSGWSENQDNYAPSIIDEDHEFENLNTPSPGTSITASGSFENGFDPLKITLFPNPADKSTSIRGVFKDQTILISDLVGRVLFSTPGSNDFEGLELDLSAFPSGMYNVSVLDNDLAVFQQKLIVVH